MARKKVIKETVFEINAEEPEEVQEILTEPLNDDLKDVLPEPIAPEEQTKPRVVNAKIKSKLPKEKTRPAKIIKVSRKSPKVDVEKESLLQELSAFREQKRQADLQHTISTMVDQRMADLTRQVSKKEVYSEDDEESLETPPEPEPSRIYRMIFPRK